MGATIKENVPTESRLGLGIKHSYSSFQFSVVFLIFLFQHKGNLNSMFCEIHSPHQWESNYFKFYIHFESEKLLYNFS